MKKSYTSRIIKPPKLVKIENLSTFLVFYDIENANDLVRSLKNLLDTSSLYSLIEVCIQVTLHSEVTLALLAIEKVAKSSSLNNQGFLQTYYNSSLTNFLTTLKAVKNQQSLTEFLVNYLGLDNFNVADLYSNPYLLFSWILKHELSYSSVFNYLKTLDLSNFFMELIRLKSSINFSEHPYPINLLEINIKNELYKNVIGSFPIEY